MFRNTVIALVVSLGMGLAANGADGPYLRTWEGQIVPACNSAPAAAPTELPFQEPFDWPRGCPEPLSFEDTGLVQFGQNVPGAGPLYLMAGSSTANVNNLGQAAFFSRVSGADRSHGIFVVDADGVRPMVMGCGGGGGSGQPGSGCGDPSPLGGTFSGIFDFTPGFNDAGDVLFMSDINGGSAPRGLFLYEAATNQFHKIVAVGDASPAGGTVSALGLGSLNNNGDVLCLAERNGADGPVDVLEWSQGTLTKFVGPGDAAPGGGTFTLIGREYFGYVDGTRVYIGNVPAINNAGQVSFFSLVSGGLAERGVFLRTGSVTEWYLKAGETTPVGGGYLDFWQPLLNEAAQIAIFADIRLGPDRYTSAWIVGEPGAYRKALAFYDSLDGGQVYGMAVSRNPVRALDDCGNLVAWCNIRMPSSAELDHTIFCPATGGTPLVIARQGDPTPIGGNYTSMSGWPSMANGLQGTYGAYTPGSGAPNAFFKFQGRARGDLNCDGLVDLSDVDPFVMALVDPAGYAAQYPDCDIMNADMNGDTVIDGLDVQGFVDALLAS